MATLIRGGLLFDAEGADPVPDGAVLVEGDRVVEVGPSQGIHVPSDAEVVDVRPDTILPGLIDMHCHCRLDHPAGHIVAQMQEPDALYTLNSARNLRKDLLSGVTTCRTVGDRGYLDITLKKAIDDGVIPGPRLFCSGQSLRPTHGHGITSTLICDGPDEMRKGVRATIKAGAEHVKIFVSGGVMSPHTPATRCFMTDAEIRAVIEEAHDSERRVSAHIHGGPGVRRCLEAGLDVFEHGAFMTDEEIDLLADSDSYLDITLGVLFHPNGIAPADLANPAIAEKARRGREVAGRTIARAIEKGVRYCVGTDGLHGLLPFEIEMLVKLGVSPVRAIQAATRNAADACGFLDRRGTLAPGKDADLIVVRGNPFQNVQAIWDVRLIMKGGRRYDAVSEW